MRSRLRGPLTALVAAVAFKVLADLSAQFAEATGASYVFPPAAVVLAAGAVGRGWGVLGILGGSLLSRWGAAVSWEGALLFAAVHTLTAVVPAYGLGLPVGSTLRRLGRVLAIGVAAAFLVSALAGTAALVALGYLEPQPAALGQNLLLWWTADVIGALALGLPVVLVLRPTLLTDRPTHALFLSWLGDRRRVGECLVSTLLAALVLVGLDRLGWGFPHWAAILFVVPLGLASLAGGLGAALVTNAMVSVLYFGVFFGIGPLRTVSGLADVVGPFYLMLVFFACFAIGGGVLGGHNRILLHRVRSHRKQLERDFERVVGALAAAIEAKDPTTEGHVQRVAAVAEAVGRRLGLDGEGLETLRYGAILHDVGKIGVPEAVLNKPGPLTPEEREAIETHVEIGVRILAGVDLLQHVVPLVKYHQERWDGSTDHPRYPGYYGLAEEEIPLGARILAVVDTFDAITHDRPYRAGRPAAAAIAELEREAGRQFDPQVVQALKWVVREGMVEKLTSGEHLRLEATSTQNE
jgi:putative nucleotidyltransferase with HDIG domain